MKIIISFIILIIANYTFGQEVQYVNANNGLIIREKPDKDSERIGKLEYGTRIIIIEETEIELAIKEGQEIINGKWVEIQEVDGSLKGYVFSGYLSLNRLSKRIEIKFENFSVNMELEVWDENEDLKKVQKDTAIVYVELGETPEGKKIKLNFSKFKNIEIYQRHENSVTIMDEGPHCDLKEWKHYYSEWKKLNYDPIENVFISDLYEKEDWDKFIDVNINELKRAVEKECGDYWSEYLKDIKNVNEYPIGVSISRIFIKILLTDENDIVTEKTISFEIPMGC